MPDANSSSLKRRLQIVDLVRKEGEVRVEVLSEFFKVSTVTIRGDLTYLEQQGYIIRAFGKAKANQASFAPSSAQTHADPRGHAVVDAKVAHSAISWVQDDAAVFLGAGTLLGRLVPLLVERQGLVLTVHDLATFGTAAQFLACELHITGGVRKDDEPGLSGPGAEMVLRSRPVDLCVIEASAIDIKGQVFVKQPGAARLYKTAIAYARQTLVLANSPDMSGSGMHPVGTLADIDGFNVNHDIEPAVYELLSKHDLILRTKSGGVLAFRRPETNDQRSADASGT